MYPIRSTDEMHSKLVQNHTPNFGTMHPAAPEIRKMNTHVQMYPTSGMCKTHRQWVSSHETFQRIPSSRSQDKEKGCTRAHVKMYSTPDFCKTPATWSPTTHKISAQSVQPFPRYGTLGYIHLRTCRCDPIMSCGISIATWPQSTHQIWWQSAHPLLSYCLTTAFGTLHAARTTCQTDSPLPQMSSIRMRSIFRELICPSVKTT